MPRDLFGQMTRPFDGVGARSRLTVPVSLAAHVLAVAAVVVVPLLAADALPALHSSLSVAMITPVVPPPPPLRRAAPPPDTPAVNPDAAPVEAPQGFGKEPEFVAVEAGAPDLGVVVGDVSSADVLTPPPPPRPEPSARAPVRVGGEVKPPAKVRHVAPVYPPIAMQAHVEGIVIISATIDIDGTVVDTAVLSGKPLLTPAAVDAVRQWRFTPTTLNGEAVPVVMTVTVNFQLR